MERLIDIPGQVREPSPDLLRRLREIEPRAEVLYVGAGRWWLGRVKTESARCHAGRQMAARIREGDGHPLKEDWSPVGGRWAALRQALLMSQGFGLVSEVQVDGEPDARIVEELRRAKFVEQGGVLESEEAAAEESVRRDRIRENKVRERELAKWLWSRSKYGRGNPAPVSVPHNITQEIAS